MITGFATPDGTRAFTRRFPRLSFNRLGAAHLHVSRAGFGCYRVNAGVIEHEKALREALSKGVNLIDTSANYADGGSERLVGGVLEELIHSGRINRDQVVVVSKGGYLQGSNYALSQQRKEDGHPFEEIVEYADGLEHCIHPVFLADQIGRSLERLGLDVLDGYLLHNPEYYLGWAHKQGLDRGTAQAEYYRRIQRAFDHLENEVERGRIRFYGVSSNAFPAPVTDPEFTSLHRIWELAETFGSGHHFRLVQLPFNLFETGAALEKNQPGKSTVLDLVCGKRLGLLANRPLNAFTGRRMVRLAGIEVPTRMDDETTIDRIESLAASETRLWKTILPGVVGIPDGFKVRVKQQACLAETLKHHWRTFGPYERWREVRDGIFLPRIQGVMDFLLPHAGRHPELAEWIPAHRKTLEDALRAVASIYADDAAALEKRVVDMIDRADDDWAAPGTLSQKAIRALISTTGVSAVLVGMRKPAYVADVLDECVRSTPQAKRLDSWGRLREGARNLFPDDSHAPAVSR